MFGVHIRNKYWERPDINNSPDKCLPYYIYTGRGTPYLFRGDIFLEEPQDRSEIASFLLEVLVGVFSKPAAYWLSMRRSEKQALKARRRLFKRMLDIHKGLSEIASSTEEVGDH